jgi:hypothetical protein
MYLRDLVVSSYREYPRKKEFNFSVGCVESIYFASLPKKVQTNEFTKIIIEAIEPNQAGFTHQRMLDVVEVKGGFDFDAYWKANEPDRKLQTLNFVQKSLTYLANTFEWDIAPFDEAYHRVIEKDFVHQFYLKKPKPVISPNKKLKAQIFIDFEINGINIYLVVANKVGEQIVKKHFVTVPPRDFFIMDTIGALTWNGDEHVVVSSRAGKEQWQIDV